MKFEKNFFIKIEKTKTDFDMINKIQAKTKKTGYIFVEVITEPKPKIINRSIFIFSILF